MGLSYVHIQCGSRFTFRQAFAEPFEVLIFWRELLPPVTALAWAVGRCCHGNLSLCD